MWTDRQIFSDLNGEQDERLAAIAVTYNLRECYGHVYWHTKKQTIWLFVPVQSQHLDRYDRILARHGFSSKRPRSPFGTEFS